MCGRGYVSPDAYANVGCEANEVIGLPRVIRQDRAMHADGWSSPGTMAMSIGTASDTPVSAGGPRFAFLSRAALGRRLLRLVLILVVSLFADTGGDVNRTGGVSLVAALVVGL